MTEVPIDGESTPPPALHLVPRDASFEHPLDETAPKPVLVHDGDGIDIPSLGGERRPIIPTHLRTVEGIRGTTGKYLDAARFHTLFHLLRVPMYLVMGVVWACVGAAKIARAQLAWWWLSESTTLRSKAVVDGNSPEWRSLHGVSRKTRSWRGAVLGAEVFAIALALVLIGVLAPGQAWIVVAAAA